MSEYINKLKWRYATKRFDSNQKLSQDAVHTLKEAVQLTASSYGLQPYKIVVISDQKTKEKLREAGFNQPQFTESSHIFVFANQENFDESLINSFIDIVSETRNIDKEKLTAYADMMKGSLLSLSADQKANWSGRQAYIALGNLLSAAAHLEIDACPMEGFNAEKFNEILGLKESDFGAIAVVALGYRSNEDTTKDLPKVRRNQEELFITI